MTRPLAVVTGGSRGVGAATARALVDDGWNVLLTHRVDAEAAERVVADCRAAGAWAATRRVDVALEDDVRALFADLPAEAGPLRGLVNNAGMVAPTGPLATLDGDRMRRVLEVNVLGVLLCAREAVRRMSTARGGEGGAIVNVSSKAAVLGSPGEYVDYAASKAAVDTVTTGLAREVAAEGIRVNSVRLGLIDTELHERNGQHGRVTAMAPTLPMGRAGTPAEVARAICWLLGPQSSYSTGAHLDVSGGR
ncbi:SDR family oxidoreductase [Nocardioides sp.]|uniref:SDR family oxidoreductase n=1 Tax=Nocardioides sp. TaxID=35761 RepID=UPI003516578E